MSYSDIPLEAWVGSDGPVITIKLTEGQRQATICALAKLSMDRPGWCKMLEEIAFLMDNRNEDGRPEMFEKFRQIWVKPLVDKLTAG